MALDEAQELNVKPWSQAAEVWTLTQPLASHLSKLGYLCTSLSTFRKQRLRLATTCMVASESSMSSCRTHVAQTLAQSMLCVKHWPPFISSLFSKNINHRKKPSIHPSVCSGAVQIITPNLTISIPIPNTLHCQSLYVSILYYGRQDYIHHPNWTGIESAPDFISFWRVVRIFMSSVVL